MTKETSTTLAVAICLPAYNEEANIGKLLESLLLQKTERINITRIVVVSSASTDKTDEIVEQFITKDSRIVLVREAERRGKAAAINLFLKDATEPVVVLQSTDTICEPDTIENLCTPFIENEQVGMTGGAPHPVNDPNTFLGYVVHTWWWFHRNIPRFGEIVAFRNVLPKISERTAVDEAYIQAKLVQLGYRVVHVDSAVVWNKGSENLSDIVKQRKRIFIGHTQLKSDLQFRVDSFNSLALKRLIFDFKINNMKELFWFSGGILIEIYSRFLGYYDLSFKQHNSHIWDIAKSTKSVKK